MEVLQPLAAAILLGVIILCRLVWKLLNQKDITPTTDDPTGEIKQKIYDKLEKAIQDIKSTV